MRTEAVRLQRRFTKHASRFDVGRISNVTDGYVVVTGEGRSSFAVPRHLARAAHREQLGDCLGVINGQADNRELIVRAVPGIDLSRDQAAAYSPFTRVKGFERVSAADAAYLRGSPVPFTISIPVVIER